MIFAQQTLYRTPRPDHVLEHRNTPEDYSSAEYRELAIKREADEEGVISFVLYVFQGWWDEAGKEAKHSRTTIRVPYVSLAAAEEAYRVQLKALAKQGYIYSFVPMPPIYPTEMKYRILKEGDDF